MFWSQLRKLYIAVYMST